MNPSPSSVLLLVSAVLGAVYFFRFFRLLSGNPAQREFVIKSKPLSLSNPAGIASTLAILCVVTAVFSSGPLLIAAAVLFIPLSLVADTLKHRELLAIGADPTFLRRLNWTSALSFAALLAILAGLILRK